MRRNRIIALAVFLFATIAGPASLHAQQTYFLNVDSLNGIPDTIYDGETITFTMVFTNQSNLGFQGDVETWMQVAGTADSTLADSTTWVANNFVAAQSQTQVTVSHLFTTQDASLSIGDNVVVVWPRIVNGPVYPPQEVVNKGMAYFYLAEPLGIDRSHGNGIGRLGLSPNPAQGLVRISLPQKEALSSVRITDMMGRTVHTSTGTSMDVLIDALPHGIYTVHAVSAKGQPYSARLMVRP